MKVKRVASGFTLIEIILAVLILGFGIVGVFRPLLSAVSSMKDLQVRREAFQLCGNKIWELANAAKRENGLDDLQPRGTIIGSKDVYHFRIRVEADPKDARNARIDCLLSWSASGRSQSVERSVLVFG